MKKKPEKKEKVNVGLFALGEIITQIGRRTHKRIALTKGSQKWLRNLKKAEGLKP